MSFPSTRRAARALTVVALAAFVLAPAVADAMITTIAPDPPVAGQHVVVTSSGSYSSPCVPAQLRMIAGPITTVGNLRYLGVQVVDDCASSGAGTVQSVAPSVDLGALEPGNYQLSVTQPADVLPVPVQFTVYRPGGASVVLPSAADDASPAQIEVQFDGLSNGTPFTSLQVKGQVVEVRYGTTPFPVLPPPGYLVPARRTVDLPRLPAGEYDVRLIGGDLFDRATLRVWRHDGCLPGDTVLCLRDGRFRVRATWTDFDGGQGPAHATPLADTDESGLLWFFDGKNAELTVKVLDGCGVNGHRWVFVAAGSNVGYTLTVEDTTTHVTRSYSNNAGVLPPLVADVEAFDCE